MAAVKESAKSIDTLSLDNRKSAFSSALIKNESSEIINDQQNVKPAGQRSAEVRNIIYISGFQPMRRKNLIYQFILKY